MSDAHPQKLALITGASRGLGFALAETLAPDYHIMAVARTSGALEELDDRIQAKGGQATLVPLDITDDGAMNHMAGAILERWGKLDLWAHTAIHGAPLAPSGHLSAKDLDKCLAINTRATSRLIGFLEPLLLAAETGTAMFFEDDHAGEKFFGGYGATKAAQMALVKSWQAETVKTGPRVLIETPAPMPTGLRARFYPGEDRSPLADPAAEAARLLKAL